MLNNVFHKRSKHDWWKNWLRNFKMDLHFGYVDYSVLNGLVSNSDLAERFLN